MLNREAIQERSYTIWEREGRPLGRDLDHWRRAEMELIAELERLHDEARMTVAALAKPKPAKAKKAGKRGDRKNASKVSIAVE